MGNRLTYIMDATELNVQLHKWMANTSNLALQYYAVTGLAFFVFFVWKRASVEYAKIQLKYPDNKQIKRELFYSVIFLLMAGTSVTFIVWLNKNGYTRAYKPIEKYGWGYYFASFFIMLALHETYFYWTHRFMHIKGIFKHVHKLHHESTNPTPFTCYAVHPIEALISILSLYLIVFTVPHHHTMATIFFSYSFIVNIVGHSGYEFLPRWFVRHKFFKWINTSVHHNLHHSNVKTNYGYYFNFWDAWMNTTHKRYEEHFEAVADRRDGAKALKHNAGQELASVETELTTVENI